MLAIIAACRWCSDARRPKPVDRGLDGGYAVLKEADVTHCSSSRPYASRVMAVDLLKGVSVRTVFLLIIVSCSAEALKPAEGPADARYADSQLSDLT